MMGVRDDVGTDHSGVGFSSSSFSRSNRILASRSVRGLTIVLGGVARAAAIIFMLVPAVLIVVLSFSNETTFVFPPRVWGLNQYRALVDATYWLRAVRMSFLISLPSAILTLLFAVPAAIALNRGKVRFSGILSAGGLAPLVLPSVAYAVAMYTFFLQMGVMGSRTWLVVVYSVLSFPYVLLIVGTAINRIPVELELVAMTLGASRRRAMIGITLRLLVQAMAASFVFAFIHSFDEATFINFIGGPGVVTLPKAVYDSVRTGLDPVILAISTILMVLTALLAAAASYWRSSGTR